MAINPRMTIKRKINPARYLSSKGRRVRLGISIEGLKALLPVTLKNSSAAVTEPQNTDKGPRLNNLNMLKNSVDSKTSVPKPRKEYRIDSLHRHPLIFLFRRRTDDRKAENGKNRNINVSIISL